MSSSICDQRDRLNELKHLSKTDMTGTRQPTHHDVCNFLVGLCESLRSTLLALLADVSPLTTTIDFSDRVASRLMLLSFCHCRLEQLSDFIDDLQAYSADRGTALGRRRYALIRKFAGGVVEDTYFYPQVHESVEILKSTVIPLFE